MERSGRSRDSVTQENIERVKQLVKEDDWFTLSELVHHMPTGCERSTIRRILHDELHYRKVSCLWVPQLLIDAYKTARSDAALEFLT